MTLLVLIVIQKKGHLSCGSIRALCTLRIICNTTSTIYITNRNSVFPDVASNGKLSFTLSTSQYLVPCQ